MKQERDNSMAALAKEAIKELFPNTDHQLCLTHFKRNITRNMSQEDGKDFKERFEQLKISGSYDEALSGFEQLILDYQGSYKTFMASVWLNRHEYLNFLRYPKEVRRYLYTTNVSENFNRRLEWIRQHLGGFFQSEEVLGINILKFKDQDENLKAELKKAEQEMAAAAKVYGKMDSDSRNKIAHSIIDRRD